MNPIFFIAFLFLFEGCLHKRTRTLSQEEKIKDLEWQDRSKRENFSEGLRLEDFYLVSDDNEIKKILDDPSTKIDEDPLLDRDFVSIFLFPSEENLFPQKGSDGLIVVQVPKKTLEKIKQNSLALTGGSQSALIHIRNKEPDSLERVDTKIHEGEKTRERIHEKVPGHEDRTKKSHIPDDRPRSWVGKLFVDQTFGKKEKRESGVIDANRFKIQENGRYSNYLVFAAGDGVVHVKIDERPYKIYTKRRKNNLTQDDKVILYLSGSAMASSKPSGYVAKALQEDKSLQNVDIVSFNYRGFGERSEEELPPSGLSQKTIEEDGEQAYKDLLRLGYRPENIYLYGYSMGAHPASYLFERHPECSGLILDRPMASLEDGMLGHMGFAPKPIVYYAERVVGGPMDGARKAIQSSSNRPILILNAQDEMDSGIKRAVGTEKKDNITVLSSKGEHIDFVKGGDAPSPFMSQYVSEVTDFLFAPESKVDPVSETPKK